MNFKRERGENLRRSGHCKPGVCPKKSLQFYTVRRREQMMRGKPGNLLDREDEASE